MAKEVRSLADRSAVAAQEIRRTAADLAKVAEGLQDIAEAFRLRAS